VDATREIVDAAAVGTALAVLSGVALLVGLALLAMARKSETAKRTGLVAVCVALGFPMWWIYNAIEDALGLDSVAGLLANLALFVALGIGVGLALRRFWPSEAGVQHGDAESR
jgi:apolipoprotein N-acyltransferase